jgi:hypothetical protein
MVLNQIYEEDFLGSPMGSALGDATAILPLSTTC